MSTNLTKKTRVNEVDALQRLADGLTQHASTVPSIVFAGVTLKPSDVVAKLQARIAQAKAVASAAANWHSMVQTDHTAAAQLTPLLAAVKQVLLAAYSTQLSSTCWPISRPCRRARNPSCPPATRDGSGPGRPRRREPPEAPRARSRRPPSRRRVTIAPATTTAVKVEGAGANPVAVSSAPRAAALPQGSRAGRGGAADRRAHFTRGRIAGAGDPLGFLVAGVSFSCLTSFPRRSASRLGGAGGPADGAAPATAEPTQRCDRIGSISSWTVPSRARTREKEGVRRKRKAAKEGDDEAIDALGTEEGDEDDA